MPDTGVQILESLRGLGVSVQVVGLDRLRFEPASRIPAEMVPRIREAKPAILAALRRRPATCSPDCYEVGPGILIHRPHMGCATVMPEGGSQYKVTIVCWHCKGEKSCGCSACWQGGPQDCVVCKGRGQVWMWVQ